MYEHQLSAASQDAGEDRLIDHARADTIGERPANGRGCAFICLNSLVALGDPVLDGVHLSGRPPAAPRWPVQRAEDNAQHETRWL
jgi:hypothetical protein